MTEDICPEGHGKSSRSGGLLLFTVHGESGRYMATSLQHDLRFCAVCDAAGNIEYSKDIIAG